MPRGLIKTAPIKSFDIPNIEKIDGVLTITGGSSSRYANSTIENLDNFKKLKSVKEVDIEHLTVVDDFTPFVNVIEALTSETRHVEGCGHNPTRDDMKNGLFKPAV